MHPHFIGKRWDKNVLSKNVLFNPSLLIKITWIYLSESINIYCYYITKINDDSVRWNGFSLLQTWPECNQVDTRYNFEYGLSDVCV